MLYVYVLRSQKFPDQIYTGGSADYRQRIADHNLGHAKHTSKFAPWDVVCVIKFEDDKRGWQFEKYLKSGSGRAFVKRHFL
ncbi:MAG: GIY-YIG nuclease family protein [Planctomycetes bacterium]|nr:GIY-YIG nuclease family protein [Planctomycetota bacterium]